MSAATLKPIRLECYLSRLPGDNKLSLFGADSLDRYLLQCAWDCPCVATSMDTHVGLNVATRSCNAYPDKNWFAVLRRFWLQCSRGLRRNIPFVHRLKYLDVISDRTRKCRIHTEINKKKNKLQNFKQSPLPIHKCGTQR